MSLDRTRRRLLALGGLAATAGLAGCSGVLDGGDGGVGGGSAPLDVVPAAADNVVYADVATILADQGIQTVANAALDVASARPRYDGPTTLEGVLSEAQTVADLDPAGLAELLSFSAYGQESVTAPQYGGAWFSASWAESALVSAVESQGTTYAEQTYGDHTVYVPEDGKRTDVQWLGVLGDGEYVSGTESAVKDVIDVMRNEADGIAERLRSAYQSARPGFLQAISTVPESLPSEVSGGEGSIDLAQFQKVTVSTASLYRDGDMLGLESTFEAADSNDASDVRAVVLAAQSTLEGIVEAQSTRLATAVDAIDVQLEGTTVTVSYADTPANLATLVQTAGESLTPSTTPINAVGWSPTSHRRILSWAIEHPS